MAIKGLVPQLAERGKIKIGEKGEMKTSAKGKEFAQPKKLDHFVITIMQRDQAGRLMPDTGLMARLNKDGQKLVELPVRLLYDDIDLNFLTRYSAYSGARCWCSGDGEVAERLSGDGKYQERSCPCGHLDVTFTGAPKCKPLGTLQVLLEGVDRVGGVWKFRTTSWNTVNAILSSLALIKTITGGPLAGIPLTMVLSPKTVTIPGGSQAGQSMVVYVVSLEYRGPEEQLAELGYAKAKLRIERQIKMETVEADARRLLVAPHQEPPQDQQETAEEFYPEGMVAQEDKKSAGTAAQEAQGGKKVAPPVTTTVTQEPATTATTEPQGGEKQRPMNLAQVMEACQRKAHINLPVQLVAGKGLHIGQWVDRYFDQQCIHLVFEMVPDLAEKTGGGLTPAMIFHSYEQAGFKVIFQAPGTERAGDEELPPTESQEEALAIGQQTQAAATAEAKKAPAKSLF
jgi:hypothetical protein